MLSAVDSKEPEEYFAIVVPEGSHQILRRFFAAR